MMAERGTMTASFEPGPMVTEATLVDPDGFCAWGEEKTNE